MFSMTGFRCGLISGLCVGLLAGFAGSAAEGAPSADELRSALARHDRAVHPMDDWMRDPYIILAPDGWFYLSGTRGPRIEGGKEGIQLWRSRDLAEWEDRGVIWTIEDSRWMSSLEPLAQKKGKSLRVWAPEFRLLDGRWVFAHTTSISPSNLLVTEGDQLTGPLSEPMGAKFGHRHDPSLFTDDDGSHWLVWGCTKTARLKPDLSGFDGPETPIAPSNRKMGHEGCLIKKIGGKYVLFGTAWSTDVMRHGTYNLYYCTADKITGPYGPRRFAGFCCGHGTPFQDREGRWWTTAFLNGEYVPPEEAAAKGLNPRRAQSINAQGLTLVPLDVRVEGGDVSIRALDPSYAHPGPEEVQKF